MSAGLGTPPITDSVIVNVSRVVRLAKCEAWYYWDYELGFRYVSEAKMPPRVWLGRYLHKFDELLHQEGWEDPGHLIEATNKLMLPEIPEDSRYEKAWEDVVWKAPELAKRTWEVYHNNQTWDRILLSEQEAWLELWDVMWLMRFDQVVEMDGKVWLVDKKTSSLPSSELAATSLWSLQFGVYSEALAQIAPGKWGKLFGGVILDYIPTDLPTPPLHDPPRTNKDGSPNKNDVKAKERFLEASETFNSKFKRIKLRRFADQAHRNRILYEVGAHDLAKWIGTLRNRDLNPERNGRLVGACKFCPHKELCLLGQAPDPSDSAGYEPDYVDRAVTRQEEAQQEKALTDQDRRDMVEEQNYEWERKEKE